LVILQLSKPTVFSLKNQKCNPRDV
jgi:hypothetical protein